MNKLLTSEIVKIIIDEIGSSSDIIDGYYINVEINGDINIKLMHRIPNKSGRNNVVEANVVYKSIKVDYMAFPIGWARNVIKDEIQSLRNKLEVHNND